ncbi:MAG TPA: peptidylprolyl isomerase [Bryobacteraceae bacterium]|nr:peptidylprolyl isomerase [Bryobacteraceae bacterium]
MAEPGRRQKPIVCPTLFAALVALSLAGCRKAQPVVVPEVFRVKFETSQGDIVVEAARAWAPHGVDRFHELVRKRYFDQGRFFRVVKGFVAQFGVHRDFNIHETWRQLFIVDDPPKEKNLRGTLAFAKSGPNTRATEIFINLVDNPKLDSDNFVPFAKVVEGMDVVDRLYSGYGEMRPEGKEIDPGRVEEEANEYLVPRFPKLDYIKRAVFVE